MKHFLKETDLGPGELGEVFSRARTFKRDRGLRAERSASMSSGATRSS
jgi:ornithine carbamoyltransferase